MPVPFSRLPYLVLKDVLQNMDFIELFIIACMSQRMRRIVKRDVKVRNFQIEIMFDVRNSFEFIRSTDNERVCSICAEGTNQIRAGDRFNMSIGEQNNVVSFFRESVTDRPILVTHWRNKFTGGKKIYEELFDIFAIPIKKVVVDLADVGNYYQSIVEWCNTIAARIPVWDYFDKCDFLKYMWIMENTKSPHQVQFCMKTDEDFEKGTLRLDVENVLIYYGSWMRLRHLQSINSSEIVVNNTSLTDRDINKLYRAVQGGSHPRLKVLGFRLSREPDLDILLEGLNAEETDEDVEWTFQLMSGEQCFLRFVIFAEDPFNLGLHLVIERT